ncbi:hypothetical protein F4779DRAFT_409730 [Xylariaceae sp. FL0662B]|nr:hypothetical protein F4779DRAFT_409730 [Xylariaceae sp. FL0662B]
MFATRALRQAATHAAEQRTPTIRFLGRRSVPENVDHTPHPHPASPTGSLPSSFKRTNGNSHPSFSSYRDSAQQHGPLRKSIGAVPASQLGPVQPPKGVYFDRNELPARFHRTPLSPAEIEAIETGGATLFG